LFLHQILYCNSEWAKEECTGNLAIADNSVVGHIYQRCKHHIARYAQVVGDKTRDRARETRDITLHKLRQNNNSFFKALDLRAKDPGLTAQIQTRMVRRAHQKKRQDQCAPYHLLPMDRRRQIAQLEAQKHQIKKRTRSQPSHKVMERFKDLIPERKTPWLTTSQKEYNKQLPHPGKKEKTESQLLEEKLVDCTGLIDTLPLDIKNAQEVLRREQEHLISIEEDGINLRTKKRTGRKTKTGNWLVTGTEVTPDQMEDSLRTYGCLEEQGRERIHSAKMYRLQLEERLRGANLEYRRVRRRLTELDPNVSSMEIEEISEDELPEYESEPTLPPVKSVRRSIVKAKGKRPPSKSPERKPPKKKVTDSETCTPTYQPKKDDEEDGPPGPSTQHSTLSTKEVQKISTSTTSSTTTKTTHDKTQGGKKASHNIMSPASQDEGSLGHISDDSNDTKDYTITIPIVGVTEFIRETQRVRQSESTDRSIILDTKKRRSIKTKPELQVLTENIQ